MVTKEVIKLEQAPVISQRLKEVGLDVTERLSKLNVNSLVASDETLKSLKSLRADLTKELQDYESQRKAVKNCILQPYSDFEDLYKNEVSNKYLDTIEVLKTKVFEVENKIKTEKKIELEGYFNELIQSMNIDFVTFDKLNLNIGLSTTIKAYKEQINAFIERVSSDIELIKTEEYAVEIMSEYKMTLDASKAILNIKSRKEREKKEKELFEQAQKAKEELAKRQNEIQDVNFEDKDPKDCQSSTKPEILSTPIEIKEEEERFYAEFSVEGTGKQLSALKDFLVSNKIIYKNI